MQSHVTRFTVRLVMTFLFILLTVAGTTAQSADPILEGLKGVEIVPVLKHETGSHLGLTTDRAYKVVEEAIRKAGIRVSPPTVQAMQIGNIFRKLPQGYAVLYFEVVTVAGLSRGGNYAVDIRFDLFDRVRLSRDNSTETIASIYDAHQLFLIAGRGGDDIAINALRDMAREFATAYWTANPVRRER